MTTNRKIDFTEITNTEEIAGHQDELKEVTITAKTHSSLKFSDAVKLAITECDPLAFQILLGDPDYSSEDKRHAHETHLLESKLSHISKERIFFEMVLKILNECQIIFEHERFLQNYRRHFNEDQKISDLFLNGNDHFNRLKSLSLKIGELNKKINQLNELKRRPDPAFVDNDDRLDEKESIEKIKIEIENIIELQYQLKNIHLFPRIFEDAKFTQTVNHLAVWHEAKNDSRYESYLKSQKKLRHFLAFRELIKAVKNKFLTNFSSYQEAIKAHMDFLMEQYNSDKDDKGTSRDQNKEEKQFVLACILNRVSKDEHALLQKEIFNKIEKNKNLNELIKEIKEILRGIVIKLLPKVLEHDLHVNNYKKIKNNYIQESIKTLLLKTHFLDKKFSHLKIPEKEKLIQNIVNEKINFNTGRKFLADLKDAGGKSLREFFDSVYTNNKDPSKVIKYQQIKKILIHSEKELVDRALLSVFGSSGIAAIDSKETPNRKNIRNI